MLGCLIRCILSIRASWLGYLGGSRNHLPSSFEKMVPSNVWLGDEVLKDPFLRTSVMTAQFIASFASGTRCINTVPTWAG